MYVCVCVCVCVSSVVKRKRVHSCMHASVRKTNMYPNGLTFTQVLTVTVCWTSYRTNGLLKACMEKSVLMEEEVIGRTQRDYENTAARVTKEMETMSPSPYQKAMTRIYREYLKLDGWELALAQEAAIYRIRRDYDNEAAEIQWRMTILLFAYILLAFNVRSLMLTVELLRETWYIYKLHDRLHDNRPTLLRIAKDGG